MKADYSIEGTPIPTLPPQTVFYVKTEIKGEVEVVLIGEFTDATSNLYSYGCFHHKGQEYIKMGQKDGSGEHCFLVRPSDIVEFKGYIILNNRAVFKEFSLSRDGAKDILDVLEHLNVDAYEIFDTVVSVDLLKEIYNTLKE